MRILIIGKSHDPHTRAVLWGLQQFDRDPCLWSWETFPAAGQARYAIGPEGAPQAGFDLGAGSQARFDVVWLRRMGQPTPPPGAHPDDRPIIEQASAHYARALLPYLGHAGTRWVNEYYANDACENKLRQLDLAVQCGFRIPDTLIGNDVAAVRAFFDKHDGQIIHKSFAPADWINPDGSRTVACTAAVSREHLDSDYAISACPGIYQERIAKRHELRVTVMGDTAIAAAIYSQQDGPSVDWRCEGGRGETNLKAIDLDPALEQLCLAYCRRLGLAFGCIDVIVTPEGEFVFLEINRWGQFLFKELADPTIGMLDSFCRFLAFGHARARPGQPPAISMQAYFASEQGRVDHAARVAANNSQAAATV